MINFALFSALSAFYFTMFITPGPNNAMLTASGMKFGFYKNITSFNWYSFRPHISNRISMFWFSKSFFIYPQIQFYMKILCFLYLLYLSWKMIGSFNLDKKESGRPLKFYEASLFQFINPKAWSIAIAVASGFFPTEENIFIGVAFVTITAAVICFPSISLWALFGSGLRTFINNEKTKKITEYFLALLLVLTGLFILIK